MFDSTIKPPTEWYLNKISKHTSSCNDIKTHNSKIDNISIIKNDNMLLEKINLTSSPLMSICSFLKKIKCPLFRQESTQVSDDIELDRVLSQGRILFDHADALHNLPNDQSNIPSTILSLTTKPGLILGGMLLASAITGESTRYSPRVGREQRHDTPFNKTHRDGLTPYHRQSRFNTQLMIHPYNELSKIQGNHVSIKRKTNKGIKSAAFNRRLASINYKKSNVDNLSPCPSIDSNQKTKVLTSSYIYTKEQPANCLTDSFNKRCQTEHRKILAKKNCHHIPNHMTLRVGGIYCWCPPPDWLDFKTVTPRKRYNASPDKKTNPTILTPLNTNATLPIVPIVPIVPIANDETFKNKTPIIYDRRFSPETNHTMTPVLIDTEKHNDVISQSTLSCYHERENLTLPKIARIISNTLYHPLSTLFNEGRIVIQYSILHQGCLDNTEFYEASKKVESVIEMFFNFLIKDKKTQKEVNQFRFASRFVAGLLKLYADMAEGKNADINTVNDLFVELLSLSKDTVSSIAVKEIDNISKDPNDEKIKNLTESLEYQDNKLIIKTGRDGKKVTAQRELNHLYDTDSKKFIFYDQERKWYVDNNNQLDIKIRRTVQRAIDVWKDPENIFFYKNSTPKIYGDNIIIKYKDNIYALIGNDFFPIEEIPVTRSIYRYVTKGNIELPITGGKNGWVTEDVTSSTVDDNLPLFLNKYSELKNNLVSSHIEHHNVIPISLAGKLSFNPQRNHYLKINNRYFLIKKRQDTGYYIEGSRDSLALQMINNKYHVKESFFDDICCFHTEPLNKLPGVAQDGTFFLDNTVIRHIKSSSFLSNKRNIMTPKDVIDIDFFPSPHIEGALSNSGNDYFYYNDMFIHIHSNNDDTYILGDINNNNEHITLYKNAKSKVYYKIPKKIKKWQGVIAKRDFCKIKRQPLSICTANYYETRRVNRLVNNNLDQGIIIDDHAERLEPYEGFRGIYRPKEGDREDLYYYTGVNNIFLYARAAPDTSSYMVPALFTLYGKDYRQRINLHSRISSISMVKDFHGKKMIICTPEEAQKHILDIKRREFDLHLEWQGTDQIHPDITPFGLELIHSRIPYLNDLSSLDELFQLSGKKVVTASERIQRIVDSTIDDFLLPSASFKNNLRVNSLADIMNADVHLDIKNICNKAFNQAVNNLNEAIATMIHSSRSVRNYITHTLKIANDRARDQFFTHFEKQLEAMKLIINEKHKENIMIISKAMSSDSHIDEKILSQKGETILGFNVQNDPLDRIYINTAMIHNPSERFQASHINMVSDTILHESVHALGKTEDYVYLPFSPDGHISEITTSFETIENAIGWELAENMNLEYLSRLYFLSHPLYKQYSISSLIKPSFLRSTFQNDPYYRSLILLNNPDTISVIIRELAQFAPD